MIEHVSLPCSHSKESRDFFAQALAPIGYVQDWVFGDSFAFFHKGHHDFWVVPGKVATPIHLAFNCDTRRQVDGFYLAALAAGGRDNGPPGVRDPAGYGPNYYAAFVLDPDGNNIEAVSFEEVKGRPSRRPPADAAAKRKKAPAKKTTSKKRAAKRGRG